MPHPEVDEGAQMIGWQPVFASSRPSNSPSAQIDPGNAKLRDPGFSTGLRVHWHDV